MGRVLKGLTFARDLLDSRPSRPTKYGALSFYGSPARLFLGDLGVNLLLGTLNSRDSKSRSRA